MPAVASSTSGYCIEMGSPQPRQRARRSSQESTGMFSYQARPRRNGGSGSGGRDHRLLWVGAPAQDTDVQEAADHRAD